MLVAPAWRRLIPGYMQSSVIEARGLSKNYGNFTAIDGIDFDVRKGMTTALLGGNGAGKTTTLSMLLGLLIPSSGSIRILGEDMLRHRHRVLSRINFSSPYTDIPHRLTVRENLTVYAHLYSLKNIKERLQVLSDELELDRFWKQPFGKLSAVVNPDAIISAQKIINDIYVDEKVEEYVLNLVFATRDPKSFGLNDLCGLLEFGASPRATINLILAAKARAFIEHRGYITPEDVRYIGADVLRHRIILTYEAEAEELTSEDIIKRLFDTIEVP